MYVCASYVCLEPGKRVLVAEEGTGSPGTGVTGRCEPPSVYWESNPGSLQEQLML